MKVTIRQAEQGDIEALADLWVEFHNFHARGIPSRMQVVGRDEELSRAISEILGNADGTVFVASVDGEVCGFAEIYLRETQANPALVQRKYAHLQSLFVVAPLRKHGIGGRLVETAHKWAVSRGATAVEVETWEFAAGPLRFYEALGYETIKRTLVLNLPGK